MHTVKKIREALISYKSRNYGGAGDRLEIRVGSQTYSNIKSDMWLESRVEGSLTSPPHPVTLVDNFEGHKLEVCMWLDAYAMELYLPELH